MRYIAEIIVLHTHYYKGEQVKQELTTVPFVSSCLFSQSFGFQPDRSISQEVKHIVAHDSETNEGWRIPVNHRNIDGFREYMEANPLYGYAENFLCAVDKPSIAFLDCIKCVKRDTKIKFPLVKYVNDDKSAGEKLSSITFLRGSRNTLISISGGLNGREKHCTLFQLLSICKGDGWDGDTLCIYDAPGKTYRVVFSDIQKARTLLVRAKTTGVYNQLEKILRQGSVR